jgi:hypothetical protein
MTRQIQEQPNEIIARWKCESCGEEHIFFDEHDDFINTIHLMFAENSKICLLCKAGQGHEPIVKELEE